MRRLSRYTKTIAAFFILLFGAELVMPNVAYGLTTGPTQPEMKGFEPISNTDMVDLFSGDFTYNIPLMQVGEYPINLAYHSGAGMDEEASWVGAGWSLNTGSVNRQMRGIPDDFNGTDKNTRTMHLKDHIITGGKFSMTLDLLGIPMPKIKLKSKKAKKLSMSLTASVAVKVDNYRGIGVDLGANVGASLTNYSADGNNPGPDGTYTLVMDSANTNTSLGSLGLDLSSQNGANGNLNLSVLKRHYDKGEKDNSQSIGFGYNSRSGATGLTMDLFKSPTLKFGNRSVVRNVSINGLGTGTIDFASDSYTPTIDHPMKSDSYTFSLHLGPEIQVAFIGLGVAGFYTKNKVAETFRASPSYGYLNSEKGKDVNDALMDFNREKDNSYSKEIKYLPIPVPTYDLFTASSQDGAGQYRAYRGSSGVFFDPKTENRNNDFSLGIEVGAGLYADVGADLYYQNIQTKAQKWVERNEFLSKGDFVGANANTPLYEPTYFKRVGEPVPYDSDYVSSIKGTGPVSVHLPSRIENAVAGAKASDKLRTQTSPDGESINVLKRNKREVRNTTFSTLTAKEASNHGLEKTIKSYNPDSISIGDCDHGVTQISRTADYRMPHHISNVIITGDDGKRSVFGTPTYNIYQEEVSFSTDSKMELRDKGLTSYTSTDNSISNNKGLENYYSKETIAPYATSYLLTAILSPDYVDVTGNGVTDDDLGTAVKFNYTKLPYTYKWRTPYAFGPDSANYNEGLMSDKLDDRANYVYGEKELWYMHSIESKTMLAKFVLEDRDDGYGVTDSRGAVDTLHKLKRLKEIRLYSKSDLKKYNNDLSKVVPIKVVHFRYSRSICPGLPNSKDYGGKTTLESVYFTFGSNDKGILNPYQFKYDSSFNHPYNYRLYDRWGNFKDVSKNPGGMNNSEFPYVLQDSALANQFASAWQLKKIILPSGGSINVTYESDDYAYVQDKRASQMCMIDGIGSRGNSSGLIHADYIYVKLPDTVSNQRRMMEEYFEGIDNLYYKFLLDLDNKGHKEFIPGYAQLDGPPVWVNDSIAKIKLKKIAKINPIARAGWQFIRISLPKYAYPGSENLESNDASIVKVIKSLVTAFGTIKELILGFNSRANSKKFSDNATISKSFVRLCSPAWKKLGGGSRVKRVEIFDDWANMSGASGAKSATYAQVYTYTTKNSRGDNISSGVASYEPMLGNDENPFRQPIRYKQNNFLALDNYYYIEQPFCESLFPGPSVGYSKVTVRSIGSGDDENVNRTGVVVSEFYTAKDYPTKVTVLGLQQRNPATNKIFKLIGGIIFDMVGVSQGYAIELNDMHGKPKSTNVFNKSGENISSVEYFYKSANELSPRKELRNDVKVIKPNGSVSNGTVGMDVETYTDMRQHTTNNLGISVKVSGGSGAIGPFPLPFFFPGIGVNFDRRCFRSASTIKIINRFAIQYKVRKMENGSTITSENLLWDAETGNVLLTKTQNEFDDPIYSFAYPAHWKYDGMAQAYRNLGTVLTGFSSASNGTITNSAYNSLLVPGDELIDVNSSSKYWIIYSPQLSTYAKRLIDKNGNIQQVTNKTLKLMRSGRRNMANTAIATISSLNNPIVGDQLDISQLTKVLDAKAAVFDELWSVPVYCPNCPSGYLPSADGTSCYKDTSCLAASYYKVCEGDQDQTYSSCGTYLYTCYTNSSNFTRTKFAPNNPFWIGDSIYCALNIATSSGSCGGGRVSSRKPAGGEGTSIIKDSVASGNNQARDPSFHGPLNRCGIWVCKPPQALPNTWLGFSSTFTAPAQKTYYIGIGGDNQYRVYVDDSLVAQNVVPALAENFRVWHLFPITLHAGSHTIIMQGYDYGIKAAFGAEIYNDSLPVLDTASSYNSLHLIFSTKDMIDQHFQNGDPTCPAGYAMQLTDSTCNCRATASALPINPYYKGIAGNWRPKSQYAYQVDRANLKADPAVASSTDIRHSGAYSVFSPFWKFNNATQIWDQNPSSDIRWIAANQVTYFNSKGSEVENKDALNRYSSALFGYLESTPVAVASNTRFRELAYDGFEDYGFALQCNSDGCNQSGHFSFRQLLNGSSIDTTSLYAHSGKYSLKLGTTVSLVKTVYTGDGGALYSFDGNGQYMLGANELAKGFSPIPGKKYILSFWVKDGSPRNPTTNIQASVNGTNLVNSSVKWPIVEGWKRVEVQFTLSSGASAFTLQLNPGGTAYFDDIRIHPFDGQMKSFAYDASSQRLMAEMDENNFATFYEYDDEGVLIRVKKETDRGIMTLKETRSSYRKRYN